MSPALTLTNIDQVRQVDRLAFVAAADEALNRLLVGVVGLLPKKGHDRTALEDTQPRHGLRLSRGAASSITPLHEARRVQTSCR